MGDQELHEERRSLLARRGITLAAGTGRHSNPWAVSVPLLMSAALRELKNCRADGCSWKPGCCHFERVAPAAALEAYDDAP